MKRAMGLVLAVFAFAVVAHADGIAYGSGKYMGRGGEDFSFLAQTPETLQDSYSLKEPGKIALDAGRSFRVSDDREGLMADVFYFDFFESVKAAEGTTESVSVRRRMNGFPGVITDGGGEHVGIVHSDLFRQVVAADEVPEPATLLLTLMGFTALAVWKRRGAVRAD